MDKKNFPNFIFYAIIIIIIELDGINKYKWGLFFVCHVMNLLERFFEYLKKFILTYKISDLVRWLY